MDENLTKAIEKLKEYIHEHELLLTKYYTIGREQMSALEKRVKLWCDRVYSLEKERETLLKVGFLSDSVVMGLGGKENPVREQKSFLYDVNKRINALKALLEDLETWGEPNQMSIEEEVKTGFKAGGFERSKSVKKKKR